MKVDRAEFLRALERVSPGLCPKASTLQSTHFNFQSGGVVACDQRVWCRANSTLPPDIEAAVTARPLMNALRKIEDEEVEVKVKDGHLVVKGDGRKAGLRMEDSLALPFDMGGDDEPWGGELDEAFSDAVELVQDCAHRDSGKYWKLACVLIDPNFVEACDGVQACRYRVKTGLNHRCLVERDAIKHVVAAGLTEVAADDSWLHTRGPDGFRMSLRKHSEEYPDLAAHYRLRGEKLVLPKNLPEVVELAETFSREDRDNNRLLIELRKDEVRVTGTGASGYASAWKACLYAGPEVKFYLPPAVVKGVCERGAECSVGDKAIMVEGGKIWRFVCSLGSEEK